MSRKQKQKKQQKIIRVNNNETGYWEKFAVWFSPRKIHIFLTLLVFLVYVNSLRNSFLSDDVPTIVDNIYAKDIIHNLKQAPYGFIYILFKSITVNIANLNPALYRFENILLHAGSANLIFLITNLLVGSVWLSFAIASIFAVHPLLTEAVTWISGQPYSFAAFFVLLAFYTHLKNNKYSAIKSSLLYYVSVSAQIISIYFAPIIFFYEFLQSNNPIKSIKKIIYKSLPYVLIVICYLSIALFIALPNRAINTKNLAGQDKLAKITIDQIPVAYGNYLSLFFWPDWITLYHTETKTDGTQYFIFLSLTIFLCYLVYYFYSRDKRISFFIFWFLVGVTPTFSPFGVNWLVAERYVYFSTIGLIAATVLLYHRYLGKYLAGWQNAIVLVSILIPLSIRTIYRNFEWYDNESLWTATARTSPSSPNNYLNMGYVYNTKGQYDKAEAELMKGISISPKLYAIWFHLGETYRLSKQYDKAIAAYSRSIEINPDIWQANQSLAEVYRNMGNYKKAEEQCLVAYNANVQNPKSRKLLSAVYIESGQKLKAIAVLEESLQKYPEDPDLTRMLQIAKSMTPIGDKPQK